MKPIATTSVVVVLLWSAGIVSAQPDDLPPRAFQRFGSMKLRHGSRVLCLAYSHDAQVLAAGGGNDPVRLWNPKTGEIIRELNEPWTTTLAFSPSGETLLFGGYQRTVRLWNFRLNKETGRLDGHKATIKSIAVSPDASLIATGSQDGAILLWDINTKSKIGELAGHTDEVNALVYHADADNNTFLVSAGGDRMIMIWEAENNKLKLKFDAGCGVLALVLSADGKTIYAAGDDHLIHRFDWNGKETGVCKGHRGAVVSLHLRGDTLVSGGLDQSIRFWNAKTMEPIRTLPRGAGDCDALAITKAGDFVATAGLNNTIRIYEALGKEVTPEPRGISSGLVGMSLAPDNRRLAAVSFEGQISIWDAQAGKLNRQWDSKEHGDAVIAFAPDNKTLATATATVRLWNADTGEEISLLALADVDDHVVSLAFSPDSKSLALGWHSGAIELWDVKQKKLVNTLKYTGSLHAVAWSPDGKKVAAAGGPKVYVFNPQTGAILKTFDFKTGPTPAHPTIKSLAFGPDSKTLAAGGWDGIARLYNLAAANPTDPRNHRRCDGHLSAIDSIAFSPDGRTIVTGSVDKTVRLWEAFSGKQIAVFKDKAHFGAVTGVAFANDGRSVFSAGMDTVGYHWDVPGFGSRKLPGLTLTPTELEDAWTTLLTEDTPRGHETMWKCIASAKQAVPFLTKQKKIYLLDPERVKKLFRDLNSAHYPTRTAAQTELESYGRWMEGRYDAAIADPPSLEYKRRIEMLKERVDATKAPSLAQERLRIRRIMLICEQSGGPDALATLKQLADRGPEEEIREEAAASVERMSKR
jgi:WD40 repeat protein